MDKKYFQKTAMGIFTIVVFIDFSFDVLLMKLFMFVFVRFLNPLA